MPVTAHHPRGLRESPAAYHSRRGCARLFYCGILLNMRKTLAIIIITAIVSVVGAYVYFVNTADTDGQKPDSIAFGTIENVFRDGMSIMYPLIFEHISMLDGGVNPSINFGTQEFLGNAVYMDVALMPATEAAAAKDMLTERGFVRVGDRLTMNGYSGELLVSDTSVYPEQGVESCGLSYRYVVPLKESEDAVMLSIGAVQNGWGENPESEECVMFEGERSVALKAMMQEVIAGFVPAH